jgi:thiol-disulfide isomerase/thioredoxin
MKIRFSSAFLLIAAIGFCTCSDVSGQVQKQQQKSLKAIIFMDTECPVTQSYMPELKKMQQEFSPIGVQFEAVFPVYTATEKEITAFLKKYQISFPGYTDKEHKRTSRYHATVMPEVVLLDKKGTIIYQGAIDNRYAGLGKSRPKATEFYLRNALEATLNGNPVMTRRTEAVGCLINN